MRDWSTKINESLFPHCQKSIPELNFIYFRVLRLRLWDPSKGFGICVQLAYNRYLSPISLKAYSI